MFIEKSFLILLRNSNTFFPTQTLIISLLRNDHLDAQIT